MSKTGSYYNYDYSGNRTLLVAAILTHVTRYYADCIFIHFSKT